MTAPFRDPRPIKSQPRIWPPEKQSLEQIAAYAVEGRRLRNEAAWKAAHRAFSVLLLWARRR